jgi:hypothetical protein
VLDGHRHCLLDLVIVAHVAGADRDLLAEFARKIAGCIVLDVGDL